MHDKEALLGRGSFLLSIMEECSNAGTFSLASGYGDLSRMCSDSGSDLIGIGDRSTLTGFAEVEE